PAPTRVSPYPTRKGCSKFDLSAGTCIDPGGSQTQCHKIADYIFYIPWVIGFPSGIFAHRERGSTTISFAK
ncbi:hypothetical protein BC938DRAFT_477024, partial [Jimgerdemannia flammicorona]